LGVLQVCHIDYISSIYDVPRDFVMHYCLVVRCCMNCCKTSINQVSTFQLCHTAGEVAEKPYVSQL